MHMHLYMEQGLPVFDSQMSLVVFSDNMQEGRRAGEKSAGFSLPHAHEVMNGKATSL